MSIIIMEDTVERKLNLLKIFTYKFTSCTKMDLYRCECERYGIIWKYLYVYCMILKIFYWKREFCKSVIN